MNTTIDSNWRFLEALKSSVYHNRRLYFVYSACFSFYSVWIMGGGKAICLHLNIFMGKLPPTPRIYAGNLPAEVASPQLQGIAVPCFLYFTIY